VWEVRDRQVTWLSQRAKVFLVYLFLRHTIVVVFGLV